MFTARYELSVSVQFSLNAVLKGTVRNPASNRPRGRLRCKRDNMDMGTWGGRSGLD